jgi:hypothetical protein
VSSHKSRTDIPLPSPGSPRFRFPCFHGTMRMRDHSPPVPPRCVAFAWRYYKCAWLFAPIRSQAHDRRARSPYIGHSPTAESTRRDDEFSQVPGEPCCACALFSDPGEPALPGHTAGRHGPTRIRRRGLSTRGNFGAPLQGISTRCLRFAAWITPHHARLASGCWLGFTGWDFVTHRIPTKGFEAVSVTSSPPLPSFAWRNDIVIEALHHSRRHRSFGPEPVED